MQEILDSTYIYFLYILSTFVRDIMFNFLVMKDRTYKKINKYNLI